MRLGSVLASNAPGKMRDLGPFQPEDINNRGQIVGTALTKKKNEYGHPSRHAFLWENGKMRLLAPQTEGDPGFAPIATDINDRGQVVGRWRSHPFFWQDGKMRDLGVLGKPMIYGEARGINDRGQVVGVSDSESDEHGESRYIRAFVWEKGTMIALPRPPRWGPQTDRGGRHQQSRADPRLEHNEERRLARRPLDAEALTPR